jgi:hypothetical protein
VNRKDARKLWVEALRSGKYKQSTNRLQNLDGVSYCCLGVACKVAEEQGVSVIKDQFFPEILEGGSLDMQSGVKDFFGIVSNLGHFKDKGTNKSLTYLNDQKNFTFEELADVIESEPEGLFVWKL